uniref:uncharacterized protein LOC105349473 n=1 Tax=Fragaria vesca subsp. vesca TaxID=101020 RepID=UPI0005C974B7|nr:PREDICTED: uncharacterized protein LOC105349473 [Fragaria vesca subsp. vesca]
MGLSGDLGLDSDPQKWVMAGIQLRAPLKPIYTNAVAEINEGNDDVGEEECGSTTPTAVEARIPTRMTCPPPPRKRKSVASKCNYVREFFTPPDLESVFIRRHVESAN